VMLTEMVKFYGYDDWPYGNTPASAALNIAKLVVCGDSENDDKARELLRQMCGLTWEMEEWDLLPETRAKVELIRRSLAKKKASL
jgi:phosphoribosylaminoimidazole carboxylase (NCAIR synthetase)